MYSVHSPTKGFFVRSDKGALVWDAKQGQVWPCNRQAQALLEHLVLHCADCPDDIRVVPLRKEK